MRRSFRLLSLAAAVALCGSTTRAASFTNGSFESGLNPGSFLSVSAGDPFITGWSVGGAGVDYVGTYWQAAQGERSVDLSQLNAGWIEQTFDTTANTVYEVLFDIAGNPDGPPTIKGLLATAAADSQAYTFDVTGHSKPAMGWETRSFLFTATGTSTTLRFAGLATTPYGAAIDNVRIHANVVPEPASLALTGLGAAGLAFSLRRRRKV